MRLGLRDCRTRASRLGFFAEGSMLAPMLALLIAAGGDAGCRPIPGAEAVLDRPGVRWIILGEMHGTAEAPAVFADLVCIAGEARPVVAAVEQPEGSQAVIDTFIASDGGPEARTAFLADAMWRGTMKDGRSSQAYLALFGTLRELVREGKVSRVVAFQPVAAYPYDRAGYERSMADRLRAASPAPGTRVIALVGNVHAMQREVDFGVKYMPAAGLLPPGETLTLNAVPNGGSAWNCTASGCGAHPLGSGGTSARGIVMGGDMPWSGRLDLGVPASASPPAVP